MNEDQKLNLDDIEVNLENLYREEVITDRKVAQLRKLIPVKKDGERDENRKVLYVGQTQLMMSSGPVPIQEEIDADSLAVALEKFPAAMQNAVEELKRRIQKMQQEQASKIVTPGEQQKGDLIV